MKPIYFLISLLILVSVNYSCNSKPPGIMYLKIKPKPKEGGKCKVVAGPNKGKVGKYDSEGSCCGSWGCTDCKGSDGKSNGKCKNKARVVVSDFLMDSTFILETTSELPSGELIHCITLVKERSGEVIKNVCNPLAIIKFSDLQESQDSVDAIIANDIKKGMKDFINEIKKGDN